MNKTELVKKVAAETGFSQKAAAAAVDSVLASIMDSLAAREPVTLIGFSLGARVIYFCLQEMAQEKGKAGLLQVKTLPESVPQAGGSARGTQVLWLCSQILVESLKSFEKEKIVTWKIAYFFHM